MKKKLLVLSVIGIMSISLTGCMIEDSVIQSSKTVDSVNEISNSGSSLSWEQFDGVIEGRHNIFGKEQLLTEVNQSNLMKKQPAPMLEWSLERENLSKRIENFNNPNKISYIYLMTANGQVVGFFDVKGKVSSVNSTLTSAQMIVKSGSYQESSVSTVESPQMDGSYGSNGDAIFWFDSSGIYHEWNGVYFMVDQAVKLNVQPIMVEQNTVK